MRSVRILLVDDEADFAQPLASRLERRDFVVTTASSGDEALVKVDEAEFDVALLDIFMPGGGYVFAPVHAIQADVPVQNMLAMWETVAEHGSY